MSDGFLRSELNDYQSDPTHNKRLERNRHLAVLFVKLCGEPLKRIYKASQEKKENTSPRDAEWFLF